MIKVNIKKKNRTVENECIGCEWCRHCGRNRDMLLINCEWCGDVQVYNLYDFEGEPLEEDDLCKVNEQDVCMDCYEKYTEGELDKDGNEVEEDV